MSNVPTVSQTLQISAATCVGDKTIRFDSDGFVAILHPREMYKAVFHLPPACGIFRTIKKEGEPIRIEKLKPDRGCFELEVYCKPSQNSHGFYGLDHCASHVWAWSADVHGNFRSTKVGFVAQSQLCFVVHKTGPAARCVRTSDGKVFVEGFNKSWDSLHEFLTVELATMIAGFPVREDRQPQDQLRPTFTDDRDGVIQWFDPWEGYGVALFNQGEVIVHWSEICDWPFQKRGRLISLRANDRIWCERFKTEEGRPRPQALDVRLYVK